MSEAVELAGASGLAPTGRPSAGRDRRLRPPAGRGQHQLPGPLASNGPPALREAYGGRLLTALAKMPNLDLSLLRDMDSATDEQFPGDVTRCGCNCSGLELEERLV